MKQLSLKLLLLTLVAQTAILQADCCDGEMFRVAPFVQWRSEGRDTARKLVGTTSHHVYLHDMESFYGTFNITPQYDQTFRGDDLAQCYFGSSLTNCNTLNIIGSLAPETNLLKDWMAENFYLPRDFKSTITFAPQVQNFLVDFNLYVGMDEWVKGLYFRVYGPVVNNRVSLHPCESVQQVGTVGYEPGFFGPNAVPADTLLQTALSFFSGCTTITVPGIITTPLLKAKIADEKKSTTGFAELRGELGWNYLDEDYHVGFNIQAAAPTGKRPHGDYLFETQVGNGKHWELGVGFSAHWTMWRSEDDERHLDFVFEADVTHLFNASQQRTFDLIGKPNSRYMLASKMNLKPTTNLFGNTEPGADAAGTITQASSQFNNEYSPVANFSTRDVNVSIGVQGDIIAMVNYTHRGFSWDIGYNYWGMSHEHIELRNSDCAPLFPANTWALKGDAQVYGFVDGSGTPVALSGTESLANIHQGTNIPKAGATPALATTNVGVDNAQFAQNGNGLGAVVINNNAGVQIQTSIQPLFINVDNLDINGAETRGSSNKLFTHFSYTWVDREDWIPYLGIGFEAELGNTGNGEGNENSSPCDHGISCALSKWAILVKGGVSFD